MQYGIPFLPIYQKKKKKTTTESTHPLPYKQNELTKLDATEHLCSIETKYII